MQLERIPTFEEVKGEDVIAPWEVTKIIYDNACYIIRELIKKEVHDLVILISLNGALKIGAEMIEFIETIVESTDPKYQLNVTMDTFFFTRYGKTLNCRKAKKLKRIHENIRGKAVLIVEDIVDTGGTMSYDILPYVEAKEPAIILVFTLVQRITGFKMPDHIHFFVGRKFEGDEWVIGSGLDYLGYFRGRRGVFKIKRQFMEKTVVTEIRRIQTRQTRHLRRAA